MGDDLLHDWQSGGNKLPIKPSSAGKGKGKIQKKNRPSVQNKAHRLPIDRYIKFNSPYTLSAPGGPSPFPILSLA